MADQPVAIPDIADPSQVRVKLLASGRDVHAPLDALAGYGIHGPPPFWFGAKFDAVWNGTAWTGTDDTVALKKWKTAILAAGGRTLMVPPGNTIVGGERVAIAFPGQTAGFADNFITAFLIKDIDEPVTIVLNGTNIIVAGQNRTEWAHLFGGVNSAEVHVTGTGTIDYKNLPFVQGACAAKTATTVDFDLDSGFVPSWSDVQRLEKINDTIEPPIWERNIFPQPADVSGPGRAFALVSGTRWRITVVSGADQTAIANCVVGQRYLLTNQVYGADAFHTRFGDLRISGNIMLYATAGIAMRTTNAKQVDFSGLTIDRKPKTNRMITCPGGGSIFQSCTDMVRGHGFYFWGLMDDPINVMTPTMVVAGVTNSTTFTAASPPYPFVPPAQGDPLVQVNNGDGVVNALGTIVSITWNGTNFTIVMSQALPGSLGAADLVYASNDLPAVDIDGEMVHVRGNGVVAQSQHVRVRGRYTNITAAAVDARFVPSYFGEGGIPSDVDIDILAENCNPYNQTVAAISVQAFLPDGSGYAPASTIDRVGIRGRVTRTAQAAVFVSSADNVDVSGVTTADVNLNVDTGLGGGLSQDVIGIYNCSHVKLFGNEGDGTIGFAGTNTTVRVGPDNVGLQLRNAPAGFVGWNETNSGVFTSQFGQYQYWPINPKITLAANLGVSQAYATTVTNEIKQFTAVDAVGITYNASTGESTLPIAGTYRFSGTVYVVSGTGLAELQLNGSSILKVGSSVGSHTLDATITVSAGDKVRLMCVDAAVTLGMFFNLMRISIYRLP